MTGLGGAFRASLLAACLALVGILSYVEYKSRNPEWRLFQAKGIELCLGRLDAELEAEQPPEKRESILKEIRALQARPLTIIEIRPFGGTMEPERCMTCHFGIEDTSKSHPNSVFGCVVCHGGNGGALVARGAHVGLRGGRNPSRLDVAGISCGSRNPPLGACHTQREDSLLNRADNVPKSLMATNAGIVSTLRFQWGVEKDTEPKFGIRAVSDGKTALNAVPGEFMADGRYSLADSHFRKFCASCHLWTPRQREKMGRLEGCAACHAPYADDGRYHGCDPTVNRKEVGHASTHTMTNLVSNDRCRACHNRSARIALNYHGEMESAQYGTPFVRGNLDNYTISDERFVLNLVPDIHHEKAMGCIDCHTGQDAMGDGTIYGHMQQQVEIRCEDCHGTYSTPPQSMIVRKDDPLLRALRSSSPSLKVEDGDQILKTSKGRPLPHVKRTPKGLVLTGKLTGKEHPVTVISGKNKAHNIRGHERLHCDTCHSAWSPQCYGCHQALDFRFKGLDHLTNKRTAGRWAEGRSYFRFERHIFGIDARGQVGILIPGCQVWNTVVNPEGKAVDSYDSGIMRLKNGLTSIAMGPTRPHTSRQEAPRCVDCHLDPKALGLGEGRLKWTAKGSLEVEPVYDSRRSGLKIDYPLEAVVSGQGDQLQSTSHPLSRPFNLEEMRKIVAIAPCLACHDRYDDPVWQRPGPYVERPPCTEAIEAAKRSLPK